MTWALVAEVSVRLSSGASCKEPACQCRKHKRLRFDPWVGTIPWRRAWQPIPVILPGESHGQRRLAGYRPWGPQRVDTTEATQNISQFSRCRVPLFATSSVAAHQASLSITNSWSLLKHMSIESVMTSSHLILIAGWK